MSISTDITRLKGAKDDLKTAINAKGGSLTTELIDDYAAAVDAIPTGTDTSSATATASDILTGKTAYISDGTEATGTCDFNADTTDATAVENSLLYGHTAYGAAGTKLTGTGAYWQYYTASSLGLFYDAGLSGYVEFYTPNALSLAHFLRQTNISGAKLTFSSALTNFDSCFRVCPNLTSVEFNGSSVNVGWFSYLFYNDTLLETITGSFDLSSATATTNTFGNASSLVTVSFIQSTIKMNISFNGSPLLSTASLLSIANGLDAASAPKTLTMHATSKTNMDNISVDNVAGVAVLGSAMTLTAFITGVKGWTIA